MSKGIFKVVPHKKIPCLTTKDLTSDGTAPRMESLRKACFPFSMLNERNLCPRVTLSSEEPTPVLLLQASFIIGGLLLTVTASHSTMGVVGQAEVVRLLSKACRDERFTDEEVSNGNLDRRNLIPILEDAHQTSTRPREQPQKAKGPHTMSIDEHLPPSPSPLTWAYFSFSSTCLVALKAHAISSLHRSHPLIYISTDDALSAYIW